MTQHIVLLGAGFSRNWGGWLADEAFEYLLGDPGIQANPDVKRLLWECRPKGGFETALAQLQEQAARSERFAADNHRLLLSAVESMFADMNKAFADVSTLNFTNNGMKSVNAFLARFDAIFSLNQDLLLESAYLNGGVELANGRRWSGPYLPGMRPLSQVQLGQWGTVKWGPDPDGLKLHPKMQPTFKLHGSSNWLDDAGGSVLIVGGGKTAAIRANAVLRAYQEEFERRLAEGARLMVIGYSFRDHHINEAIVDGTASAGTAAGGLFIIDPLGADAISPVRPNQVSEPRNSLHDLVIGASRRSLGEIFGRDTVEVVKLYRFFGEVV